MKLALIGADQESLELIRWAVREGGHELVSAFDIGLIASELRLVAPGVRLSEDWESLLIGSTVDVVVVGRGGAGLSSQTGVPDEERRADQLRKLAQAAVPMLVFVPACEAIVGYEIEMIRRDVGGFIWPFVPWVEHPGIHHLVNLTVPAPTFFGTPVRDGVAPIGHVEQVVFERQQTDRSRPAVLAHFARDVTLIHWLVGDIRSINASASSIQPGRDPLGPRPKELPPLANLSVSVGGAKRIARWSIGPVVEKPGAKLTLIGEHGSATLLMPEQGDWSLDVVGEPSKHRNYLGGVDYKFRGSLDLFPNPRSQVGETKFPYWLDACRYQEATEAVDRSLARGRTIELFNEEISEEQSFKSVMSMGGCLLLMMAMAVVGLAAIVEGLQLPLRDWPVWHWWPVALLVPVVVFLLLQLLQLAVKRNPAKAESEQLTG